jgi:hypothetical protein
MWIYFVKDSHQSKATSDLKTLLNGITKHERLQKDELEVITTESMQRNRKNKDRKQGAEHQHMWRNLPWPNVCVIKVPQCDREGTKKWLKK